MQPSGVPIISIGHALAAFAYGSLLLLALTIWRNRPHATKLALATAVSLIWVLAAEIFPFASPVSQALEVARDFAWLALLFSILKSYRAEGSSTPGHLKLIWRIALIITLIMLPSLILPAIWSWLPRLTASSVYLGMIGLNVLGLVLVEQVYRGCLPENRWSIKYLGLGLGGLFAYDFYLYANGLLFQQINADVWAARGLASLAIVPLIAISFSRQPSEPGSANVALSRRVMFHGVALVGAGVYLLLMAAAGYYIRIFGGNWGGVVQTAFFFAAVVLLGVLLFSGTLRARARVWMSKHFFRYHYDYRVEWLNFTRMLSEGATGEKMCERTVAAIASLVESPGGAIWLLDENNMYARNAFWNMSEAEGAESGQSVLANWLMQRQWVIDLDEYGINPQKYGELQLPAWIANLPDAWLLIPLLHHEQLIGFIILKHSLGKIGLNWEVGDLIKTAARQAATHLAQMRAANALIVARQFESYNRATTFVIHDLKNLVAQLSLLLANAQKHKHNPEFQEDMIATVESSVTRMNKVLAQLKRGEQAGHQQSVDLRALLPEVVASKSAFRLKPTLVFSDGNFNVRADSMQLGRVIGHVLQNALEATHESGSVTLQAKTGDGNVLVEISDTGSGMDTEFIRDRLFRPFDSTKGAGMGIGAYECREYVHGLGGKIVVLSQPGKGTTFQIYLPSVPPDSQTTHSTGLREQAA